MRMKLSFKFFLAFLLTSLTIVVLMVVIVQLYAYRNFSSYIAKMELLRLRNLASRLSEEYRKDNGWEKLKNSPRRWRELANLHQEPPDFFKEQMPGGPLPPPLPPDAHGDPALHRDRPPPHDKDFFREGRDGREPPDDRGPPFDGGREPGHPPDDRGMNRMPPPFSFYFRLTLFDAGMQPVVGNATSGEGLTLQAITVDNATVGLLGLKKEDRLSDPLDIAFFKRQSEAFYTIGALMLVLAAVVALLLSRHLLAPVQQLIRGTRALTSRRFDTRINVGTSDELGQLAADFNQMARTLEKYEQLRQQWISDIAHELRTPLAVLCGEIEALQDGVRQTDPQTLASLHDETMHLSKIVNDLHNLSLAESGMLQVTKKPLLLLPVVRACLQKFQARFAERGITIVDGLGSGEDICIAGDYNRLMQVFSNLLENTLRYTDAPGTLNVSRFRTRDQVVLRFADTKPGVPQEALDRLFDRLYRVEPSRGRELGGSGLGLAICKTLVEAHGGTINARHSPLGGVQIEITLPLQQEEVTTNPTTGAAGS